MTDLTAITTPFELLDEDTQQALMERRSVDKRLKVLLNGDWCDSKDDPRYTPQLTYRAMPQPPKPREWWLLVAIAKETEAEAIAFREECDRQSPGLDMLNVPIIHVREVLE